MVSCLRACRTEQGYTTVIRLSALRLLGRLILALAVIFLVGITLPDDGWAASVDEARQLMDKRQVAKAEAMINELLTAQPEDRAARYLLAEIRGTQGNLEAAYRIYDALLAESVDDAITRNIRRFFAERGATPEEALRLNQLMGDAQRAFAEQRFSDAIAALKGVVELAPGNMPALTNLVRSMESAGDYAGVTPYLERLVEIRNRKPGVLLRLAIAYERSGRPDDSLSIYNEVLEIWPKGKRALLAASRILLFTKQDVEAALPLARRAVLVAPEDPGSHYMLGAALDQIGDADGAIAAYRQAVALNEALYQAQFRLGSLLFDAGREGEALAAFAKVVEHGGDSIQAQQARRRLTFGGTEETVRTVRESLQQGIDELDTGNLEGAIASFQKVLDLAPDNALALFNLATAYSRQGRNDLAVEALEKSVAADETYYESHYFLARIYAGDGRFEDAYKSYKAVIQWAPPKGAFAGLARQKVQGIDKQLERLKGTQEARDAFLKGMEQIKLKNADAAIKLFEKAISLDDQNPFYHYNLAILYVEKARLDDAYREFRTSVALKPDHVQSHFRLGLFFELVGLPTEALKSFQKVIEFGTDEPEVEEAKKRLSGVRGEADDREKATAYLILGNALVSEGDPEKGLIMIRKAWNRAPGQEAVQTRMIEITMQLERHEEALEILEPALAANPEHGRLLFNAGQIYQKLDRMDEAETALRGAYKQLSDNPQVVVVLARFLEERGQEDEALEVLEGFLQEHPDHDVTLELAVMYNRRERWSDAADTIDTYLKSNEETVPMLVERGNIARQLGGQAVPTKVSSTSSGASASLEAVSVVSSGPRYATPEEWFQRAIAIGEPDDPYVQRAQLILFKPRPWVISASQTVIDFNTNANNSSTDPKAGASSNLTINVVYKGVRWNRFQVPMSLSSGHRMYYTFQRYVNTNTYSVSLPIRLKNMEVKPRYSTTFTRTQKGSSSFNDVIGADLTFRLKVPQTLTMGYTLTDFSSYTNTGNNYLQSLITGNIGQRWTLGENDQMNLTYTFRRNDRDAVALNLDTARTDHTFSLGNTHVSKNRGTITGSVSMTLSHDIRPGNIRPETLEVVPIESNRLGSSLSWYFKLYPKVSVNTFVNYSISNFTAGRFQTVPNPDPDVDTTTLVEVDQKQASLSVGATFTLRLNKDTTWVLSVQQEESKASIDVPTSLDDLLDDQVVQDNINKNQTVSLRINYTF
ncbi:MAG: tetratricopeptide repeat protein [Leptospirillia bacterium]